jgi:hypothetical protein
LKSSSYARKGNEKFLSAPIFVSLSVFIVLLTKVFEKVISPWDEIYHLAYVQYMYNFSFPRLGDEILNWSKYAFSCYPVHFYGMTTTVPCGSDGPAQLYPASGTNTASLWPPIYYFLSSTWVRLFNSNIETALFTARVFSAFIWSMGCGLLCFVLIKRNKFSPIAAASLITIVGVLPMGIFQGAFVTPYAAAPILVAMNYWLFTSNFQFSSLSYFKLGVFSIVSILTIPQMIAVTIFFTLKRLLEMRAKNYAIRVQDYVLSFSVIALSFLATLIWVRIQDLRSLSPSIEVYLSSSLTANDVFNYLFLFIPHSIDGYQFLNPSQTSLSYFFSLVFIAMLLKPLLIPDSSLTSRIKVSLLVFISSSFAIFQYFVLKYPIPSRYGIPIILAAVALTTEFGISKVWSKVLSSLAIAAMVLAIANPVFGSI